MALPRQAVLQVLGRTDSYLHGHFVFVSGRHGEVYINKDAVLPHTKATLALCGDIAEHFRGHEVEVVVGPQLAGIIIAHGVADRLTTDLGIEVLAIFAEKVDGGGFALRRGYDKLVKEKNVLVVEDIFTTGGSVRGVIEVVKKAGGRVVGVGGLVNRGKVTASDLGINDFYCIVEMDLSSYTEEECHLCAIGVPVNTEVGHGAEFSAKKSSLKAVV